MNAPPEANLHFKRLLAGAPQDVAAQFGEALVAVDAQRRGAAVDAPALLRRAWFALARHLITSAVNELNPEQASFLLSGAVADSVWVKTAQGGRIEVQLLEPSVYAGVLAAADAAALQSVPAYIMAPHRRIAAVAKRKLLPLGSAHPRKPKELPSGAEPGVDFAAMKAEYEVERNALASAERRLRAARHSLTELLRAEGLAPIFEKLHGLGRLAAGMCEQAADPQSLAAFAVPAAGADHPVAGMLSSLKQDLDPAFDEALAAQQDLVKHARRLRAMGVSLAQESTAAGTLEAMVAVTPEEALLVARDVEAANTMLVQLMQNNPQRTAWSASRVLLREHTPDSTEPLQDCYATPSNLAAAIRKVDALHPNCFPHDAVGAPVLPPIVIEPGVGGVRWLDDRYILCFVCTEPARQGKDLPLTPVEIAVLQVYGHYLARGDIFNYRGERVSGNFMGEYAGEIETKAAVKFTGEKKKMTYVSAATEKDAASREDAVRDYVDFLFYVFNGLPIPKRISPRKISVFLKYCILTSRERTAMLVLRHVAPLDHLLAREILNKLADKTPAIVVRFFENALAADPQIASRYRRDLHRALEEVMGREFLKDAIAAGAAAPKAMEAATAKKAEKKEEPPPPPPPSHDYFDV